MDNCRRHGHCEKEGPINGLVHFKLVHAARFLAVYGFHQLLDVCCGFVGKFIVIFGHLSSVGQLNVVEMRQQTPKRRRVKVMSTIAS